MRSFLMGGTLPPFRLRRNSPAGSSYRTPPRIHAPSFRSAFTLLELSVVVMVLALLAAAALRYASAISDTNKMNALNASLDTIEATLLNYRIAYGTLPCPADLTVAENSSSFGVQTDTLADGNCTGYNFINSAADPDGDATTVSQVVAGALPTKTLGMSDKYAYDPWGRKLLYVIDKRMTATGAFLTYPVTTSGTGTPGAIEIKYSTSDSLANALTSSAVYAIVAFGKDGHGSWVRNISSSITLATRYSSGSTNTDEQKNCHCNSSATATTFDRIFIQKTQTNSSSGTLTAGFDDVVRYKTRSEMATSSELQ
ncbi:MAG TPA: prepilin-type N-terminal cleavage/methylation domain-containing protein [Rickettsiales bacterium]|nr:prepilin-type N-terminal cleavage/methylation domain-containing protein [Rickettsiales bacterium]